MRAFTLEIDELAALVGFLNAKKLVGLDEGLFRAFSEENLPRLVARLNEHGWLRPAERPGTWHFNEDLMQALAVAVAPQVAVLARSLAQEKSVVFYLADDEITEIVVTAEEAVVVSIDGLDEMVAQVIEFLRDAWPGELVVARVKGDAFDAGRRAQVDASGTLSSKTPGLLPAEKNAWSPETIAAFVRGAMADLRAGS
ncbi:MAG TPA: hypothetical protein VE093_20220 [Polyangiaceae bacterium]|jgi:hypothetical protein|nr:hypothetical protein [Polyangiaceae bacterium]